MRKSFEQTYLKLMQELDVKNHKAQTIQQKLAALIEFQKKRMMFQHNFDITKSKYFDQLKQGDLLDLPSNWMNQINTLDIGKMIVPGAWQIRRFDINSQTGQKEYRTEKNLDKPLYGIANYTGKLQCLLCCDYRDIANSYFYFISYDPKDRWSYRLNRIHSQPPSVLILKSDRKK